MEKKRTLRNFASLSRELEEERFSTAGQLARGVLHELNSPLTVIVSSAQYLLKKLEGKGLSKIGKKDFNECLQDLEKIADNGMKCGAITSWFVRLTSQEESKIELIDINKAIQELILMVTHPFSLEKVDINTRLSLQRPKVKGDKELLMQVFLRLMLNAKQAMPNGGRLTIKTSLKDKGVEINLSDKGVRGRSKRSPQDLGIPYKVIEAHGGTVNVESKKGKGTTLTIKLPAEGRKG